MRLRCVSSPVAAIPLSVAHVVTVAFHRLVGYGHKRRYDTVTTLYRLAIVVGFLFRNESFSFEALRAAGAAPYDGADLGEVLATTRLIREGDLDGWLRCWQATAERVHDLACTSLTAGHRVSARQAFLRASNYYRTAEFFRRGSPIGDRLLLDLSRHSREAFGEAIELMDRPVERVAIPYDDIELPGYLFRFDDSPTPRPLIIYTNGYDSTAEESWFAIAAAALERGYHVLAYDGPGQGA